MEAALLIPAEGARVTWRSKQNSSEQNSEVFRRKKNYQKSNEGFQKQFIWKTQIRPHFVLILSAFFKVCIGF